MDFPAYDDTVHPDIYIAERDRLELLYKNGKLDIIARRDVSGVKSYNDYLTESTATNARIYAKYGASAQAIAPMHKHFEI